jgi:mannitol-specific phosphotransferase system IIBC component
LKSGPNESKWPAKETAITVVNGAFCGIASSIVTSLLYNAERKRELEQLIEANNQILFKKMDEDKKEVIRKMDEDKQEERDLMDKKILENNKVLIDAFAKMLGK